MNVLTPLETDFDSYFASQESEAAKVRPASDWRAAVVDRFYGEGRAINWTPTGFDKMAGKFDLRPGEVTVWAGINKHGKTTFLSNVVLHVLQKGQKVCIASLEMPPAETMAKMTKQAAGVETPSIAYINAFSAWTDDKLWLYNHTGRLASSRVLAVATFVRKELGMHHLVVDSLMKCGIGVDDLTGQKDFIDGLCAIARDTGLHIHLVCHMRKGENERMAPGKFDVKGAGEITDMVNNVIIVWKNLRKTDKPELASEPDVYVRVAGQRGHPFEGSFAFWFDPGSQQYTESEHQRPGYMELQLQREAA